VDARPAGLIFRNKATPTHSHLLKYGGRSLDQSLRAHRGRRAHFGGSPHHLRRTISGPAEVPPKPQRIIWIDRWDRHPYLFGADLENTVGKFLIRDLPCREAKSAAHNAAFVFAALHILEYLSCVPRGSNGEIPLMTDIGAEASIK
jgi:hypothetical protein